MVPAGVGRPLNFIARSLRDRALWLLPEQWPDASSRRCRATLAGLCDPYQPGRLGAVRRGGVFGLGLDAGRAHLLAVPAAGLCRGQSVHSGRYTALYAAVCVDRDPLCMAGRGTVQCAAFCLCESGGCGR